jgi:hypothetical protein
MREVDGLVFTEEEVNLDRLEKHIFVWKLDMEGGRGGSSPLESMLAERLMRESALLMRTLMSYVPPEDKEVTPKKAPMPRGGVGVAARPYRPQPLVKEKPEKEEKKLSGKVIERRNGAAWAGGVVDEGNSVKRVKRNVFGDIMHQLFGVATDEQMQQQLRVDEEMRSKVADTLSRQVYFEKELTMAVGNITEEEERMEGRLRGLEEKHDLDRERAVRMSAHRFTLMEDVDRLEDVLEAVVTGAVNTRHAAYLSSKAGLSRVASYEFLNLTMADKKVTVRYLTRLFTEVSVEVIATSASVVQVRTPSREYYLHISHGPEMPLTELEVQGTRDECASCALLVHTGSRRYLTVEGGNLTCNTPRYPSGEAHDLSAGEVLTIERGARCANKRVFVTGEGRHVSHYMVRASGSDPLDSLVLRRRERVDQKLDGSHSITSSHSALNMHLRQNLGMAQQDIENLITETQESFKMYTVTSSGTTAWLSVITLLAIVLVSLIVRKFCQRRKESHDDTVFVPTMSPCA